MQDSDSLRSILRRIDGKSYGAYKDIRGTYNSDKYTLIIDHVQGDPFAAPSRVRVRVPLKDAGFAADIYSTEGRVVAFCDFLARRFVDATSHAGGHRGSGGSGVIRIEQPGQEVLKRTSVILADGAVEARFVMGLPAHGRRIAGSQAEAMFFEDLPEIVASSLYADSCDLRILERHITTYEDAEFLRDSLLDHGLIAFVADGAVLPRASGVDDRPAGSGAVPFRSPPEMSVEVNLPNSGTITGMGISQGITLIVGGGYHGKSTLLHAIEKGIYNHIPGDGREFVVTDGAAVKIRAEDGRRVEAVDISPFISNLPYGQDTHSFSTDDASGSTSQAAAIMEALEAGVRVLLIDEDTSATNFMIRDHRMQELVSKEKEPITPFIDKVGQLSEDLGVSTILVVGGSGDYFDVADSVICMEEYLPRDRTREAEEIARKYATERSPEGGTEFGKFFRRIPLKEGIDARKGKHEKKISPRSRQIIQFGTEEIDLSAVEQIVETGQTRAIGEAIYYSQRYMETGKTLAEVLDSVFSDLGEQGLDVVAGRPVGDLAYFRRFELTAAINRLRTMKAVQEHE